MLFVVPSSTRRRFVIKNFAVNAYLLKQNKNVQVKRLRARVEELKRELAAAEDELDSACNHVRRLQRTNEELSGQTEGLHEQIQHLQIR